MYSYSMPNYFEAPEGQYHLCSCPLPPHKDLQVNSVGVRLSFLENFPSSDALTAFPADGPGDSSYSSCEWSPDSMYCINLGKEIYVYLQENQNIPIDRRIFKASPTCHAFKPLNDDLHKAALLVGLINGEIQIIYPTRKDVCKIYNEEKAIDKTSVTCIGWVPESPNQFLVGHMSGHLYLYDDKLPAVAALPSYELFKEGMGFSVHTCKTKSTRNPLYRWTFRSHGSLGASSLSHNQNSENGVKNALFSSLDNGFHHKQPADDFKMDPFGNGLLSNCFQSSGDDNMAINQFAFSPCGVYLALVTQDGYLRVMKYHTMELYGFMRSYFAGLLCVDWSPDSRFVAVGGQDDLISIWSMSERAVICRGQGHHSWVSTVRFDPFMCLTQSNLVEYRTPSRSPDEPSSVEGKVIDDGGNKAEANPPSLSDSQSQSDLGCGIYRLGSIGQDTLFCLWDLTEDIIRQGTHFVRDLAPHPSLDYGVDAPRLDLLVSPQANSGDNPSQTSSSGQSSLRNAVSSSAKPQHKNTSSNGSSSSAGSNLPPGRSLLGFLTINRRKTNQTNSSTSHSSSGSHAFGSERSKRSHTLNHRLSLGTNNRSATHDSHFVNADKWHISNGTSSKTSSLGRISQTARVFDVNDQNLFGSPMCPRFGDVPVLEPIVSPSPYQHRLTDLVFRRNTIHIVCQQGLIYIWARPVRIRENESVDDHSGSNVVNDKIGSPPGLKNSSGGGSGSVNSNPLANSPGSDAVANESTLPSSGAMLPALSSTPTAGSPIDPGRSTAYRTSPYSQSGAYNGSLGGGESPYQSSVYQNLSQTHQSPQFRSSIDYGYNKSSQASSTRLYGGRSQPKTSSTDV